MQPAAVQHVHRPHVTWQKPWGRSAKALPIHSCPQLPQPANWAHRASPGGCRSEQLHLDMAVQEHRLQLIWQYPASGLSASMRACSRQIRVRVTDPLRWLSRPAAPVCKSTCTAPSGKSAVGCMYSWPHLPQRASSGHGYLFGGTSLQWRQGEQAQLLNKELPELLGARARQGPHSWHPPGLTCRCSWGQAQKTAMETGPATGNETGPGTMMAR